MTLYQQLVAATDEDSAYYLARNLHRRRNDSIETQIYAALADAITQARLGRLDFARSISNILDTADLPEYAKSIGREERAILSNITA